MPSLRSSCCWQGAELRRTRTTRMPTVRHTYTYTYNVNAAEESVPGSCRRRIESIMCAGVIVCVDTTEFDSLSITTIVTEPPAPILSCPDGGVPVAARM